MRPISALALALLLFSFIASPLHIRVSDGASDTDSIMTLDVCNMGVQGISADMDTAFIHQQVEFMPSVIHKDRLQTSDFFSIQNIFHKALEQPPKV